MAEDLTNHGTCEVISTSNVALASPAGYELIEEIGRGGMGVVYRASDIALDRDVAVKLLSDRFPPDSPAAQRFLNEARVTGQLQHPGIPAVHQVGAFPDGRPFLAMKLIKGNTLATILKERAVPSAERGMLLGVFESVCQAVGYAHAHQVIHRDIKPANVMVGAFGEVQVMDWGLAKVIGGEPSQKSLAATVSEETQAWTRVSPTPEAGSHTQAGSLVGTPAFIAPEQAGGELERVDQRADVFGLGALLTVILTGKPPYIGDSVESLRLLALRGKLDDCFARLDSCGAEDDLIRLCKRCLSFEPAERPHDAGEVAKAVSELRSAAEERAQLAERNRLAAEVKAAEQIKRRKAVQWAAATIAAVLLLGVAGTTAGLLQADRERKVADAARKVADDARDEAVNKEKAERWERYRANLAAAASALQLHNVGSAQRSLDAAPEEHRGWEWRHFSGQLDDAKFVLRGHQGTAELVAFSPDGRYVAASGSDKTVRLWDAATGKDRWTLRSEREITYLAFNAEGTRIGIGSNRGAVVWDVATGNEAFVVDNKEPEVAFFPFGKAGVRRFTFVGLARRIHLLNMTTGKEVANCVHEGQILDIACSRDGNRIATSGFDKSVRLWDAQSGMQLTTLRGHESGILSVCFSPDGKHLATGGHFPESALRLWNIAKTEPIAVLRGHANSIKSIAYSPDGSRIASASMDQTVRLWEGATGEAIAVLRGHSGLVECVAFSPDGKRLVSASTDRTLRLWDAATGEFLSVLRGHTSAVESVAFSPDGTLISSASHDGTVRIWDLERAIRRDVLRGHTGFVYDVAFSPDGTRIASASWDGTVRLWDPAAERQTEILRLEGAILLSVAFSPKNNQIAALAHSYNNTDHWHLWDILTAKTIRKLNVPSNNFHHGRLAINSSGNLLAVGGHDGKVRIWETATGEPIAILAGHEATVKDVAFDPAGRHIASAGLDNTLRIWDVAKKEQLHVLRGHIAGLYAVSFSPDGKWIASGSLDGTARLWDALTLAQIAVLNHGGKVYKVAFSPDGSRLATACADNTIRIWDMKSHQEVAELRGHHLYVHSVAWSPDGTKLVSGSGDHTVRIWNTQPTQARKSPEVDDSGSRNGK